MEFKKSDGSFGTTKTDLSLILSFLILVLIVGIYYFDYYYVPDSDFFALRNQTVSFMNYQLPDSFQRLPLYSLLMGMLSALIPFKQPILFAGQLINLAACLVCCILLYSISKKFIGRASFVLIYLFAFHPLTVYMTSEPRTELLTVTLVLLGIFLAYRALNTRYLAGFLCSLSRYEGSFLILALAVRDLTFSKRRLFYAGLTVVSSAGLITWLALNYKATGHINPYHQYFAPHIKAAGFEYIRVVILTLLKFLAFPIINYIPLKCVTVIVLALTTIGFWTFFRQSLKDTLPIFAFFSGCTLLNLAFFSPTAEHAFVTIWIFLLALIGGSRYVISYALCKSQLLQIKANFAPSQRMRITCYGAAFLFGLLLLKGTSIPELPNALKAFHWATFTLCTSFALVHLNSKTFGALLAGVSLIICLLFFTGYNAVAIHAKMNSAKYMKAELRITGEWYSQNAAKDEKMVVTASQTVRYYADQFDTKNFIDLGSFEANCHNAFIEEAQQMGIDYVVWDCHHGNLDPDNFYYKKYKVYLISELREGKDTEYFTLIKTIRAGPRYAYIYRYKGSQESSSQHPNTEVSEINVKPIPGNYLSSRSLKEFSSYQPSI